MFKVVFGLYCYKTDIYDKPFGIKNIVLRYKKGYFLLATSYNVQVNKTSHSAPVQSDGINEHH